MLHLLLQSRKFAIFCVVYVTSIVGGLVLVVSGKADLGSLSTVILSIAGTAASLIVSIGLEDAADKGKS